MRQALEAGKRKLAVYYGKTTNAHGHLYAIGTILAPSHKLNYFSGDEWSENEYEWRTTYRDSFFNYIQPYQLRLSKRPGSPTHSTMPITGSRLSAMLDRESKESQGDEIQRYLDSGELIIL
jgi:hypothetical protein